MWRESDSPALREAWRAEDFKSLRRYRVVPVRRSSPATRVWGGILHFMIVRVKRCIKYKGGLKNSNPFSIMLMAR